MDFEKLSKVIPKPPLHWTTDDVAKWLTFINLEQLQPKFRKSLAQSGQEGIDGSILQDLEEVELERELQIKSNIIRRKLLAWVKSGLRDFTNYLDSCNKENVNRQKPVAMDVEGDRCNPSGKTSTLVQQVKQLTIKPQEGTQCCSFCVTEDGGRIGRHSSNNLLVVEESVSRYHAEITYDRKRELFKLSDLNSSTGTYIKITGKMQIRVGIMLELGSYQFVVTSCTADGDQGQLLLTIIDGPASDKQRKLVAKPSQPNIFNIGRKETNELYFEDTHMSSLHAKFIYYGQKWWLEDSSSTNGSWQKLAWGEPVWLENNSIFKVGTLSIFSCSYSDAKLELNMSKDTCVVCYESERDALYMPCRHNLVCLRCSKQLKECPMCRVRIDDIIRIYK